MTAVAAAVAEAGEISVINIEGYSSAELFDAFSSYCDQIQFTIPLQIMT